MKVSLVADKVRGFRIAPEDYSLLQHSGTSLGVKDPLLVWTRE